jgi:hypothetical protein
MVIVFKSSQFARPAAKSGIIFIFICVILEMILTIVEIILIAKMYVDSFDPKFKDYTHGLVNTIFLMNLAEHLLFLFLYCWQVHLARNCLKACETYRKEYMLINKLKGTRINLRDINLSPKKVKISKSKLEKVPETIPQPSLNPDFLDYATETKVEEKIVENISLKPKKKFQLKDLSQRNVTIETKMKESSFDEEYSDVINEKQFPNEEESEKEEIVEETFDQEDQRDSFLNYEIKSDDDIKIIDKPAKKNLEDVFNEKSDDKGI